LAEEEEEKRKPFELTSEVASVDTSVEAAQGVVGTVDVSLACHRMTH